ncbi:agmatinase [Mesorhizobium australicum]|uniref:Agmatinase n=1 Tax=Mesorhizobium australicum TaxID=536018 RepID=A0A1X7P8G6_9HYPH|nr:agmatinase [Mesorhizobium australicum]SMH46678.1 agmatinase [Mesorhizobium australicum]
MNERRFAPIDSIAVPRFAGPATFMRLPVIEDPALVDIAIFGVPWDGGTTNRPGPRHGPRQVRDMSGMIRRVHGVSKRSPYDLCKVADLGDAPTNPIDLHRSLESIAAFADRIVKAGAVPLAIGGDHLSSLALLRAAARSGPVGMIHFDAHQDMADSYFGGLKYTHGTPFRRAIEEGLLDPRRVVQIGIRGSIYSTDDEQWTASQGIRVIPIEEADALGPDGVAAEARRVAGSGPTYLSFDIDSVDPAFAPGTGTPEVAGLLPREVNAILRGLKDVDLVAADVVEVSPPFDAGGGTALLAANIAFEILCLLAECVALRRAAGR